MKKFDYKISFEFETKKKDRTNGLKIEGGRKKERKRERKKEREKVRKQKRVFIGKRKIV